MKRKFLPLVILCSTMLLFASCLGDNDNGLVSSNDAAIISFSIKTLKQKVHTTTKSGKDSTYQTNFTASAYKFYIDQRKKTIYNPDSLPHNVDIAHVICAITAKNGGIIAVKNVKNDSLKYFQATDSVDFSASRQLVVYSNSGRASVRYTVQVNRHNEKGSDFKWIRLTDGNADLGALAAMRLLINGQNAYVFGRTATDGKIYRAAVKAADHWQEVTPNIVLDTDFYRHVVVKDGSFYGYQNGKVLKSADAETWAEVQTVALQQLTGASSARLYALTADGKMMVSANDGVDWIEDALGSSAALLPQSDFSFVVEPVKTNAHTHRLLMIGTTNTHASLWGKIEELDSNAENQPWTYYTPSANKRYVLPNLINLQAVRYGDGIVAMGGAGKGESADVEAFSQLYYSKDGGLTWMKEENLTFPNGFQSSRTSFALASDTDNFLWIVCGETGQVWKGRHNRLGWTKVKKHFTE